MAAPRFRSLHALFARVRSLDTRASGTSTWTRPARRPLRRPGIEQHEGASHEPFGMGATLGTAREAQQLVGMPARGACGYGGGRRCRRCTRRRQAERRDRVRNDACRNGLGARQCRCACLSNVCGRRPVTAPRRIRRRAARPPLSQPVRPRGGRASACRPGTASKRRAAALPVTSAWHDACALLDRSRRPADAGFRRSPPVAARGGRDQPSATGVTSRRPRPIGCTAPAASASAGEES